MANDNGKTWDGSFTLENSAEHAYPLKNPRIYLVVPSTVNPQSLLSPYDLDPQGSMFGALEWPAKAKLYQAGGKYVIEFDGQGTTKTFSMTDSLSLNYQLKVGMPSSSDSGEWFISADNLDDTADDSATADEMKLLKGAVSGHTFKVPTNPVIIQNMTKQQSGELAQGNEDNGPYQQHGTSNDKQSADMTYVRYVMADKDSRIPQMTNVVAVTNLPQSSTSSFSFQLKPNGVTVLNRANQQPFAGATILYSTQLGNSNNVKTDLASYKPANEVTDWSQIKSVAVKVPKLTDAAFEIVFAGTDPTLPTDAQKVGVLTGQTWCDEIPVPMYNGLDAASKDTTSSVKIEGQSTIHILYRYKDKDGVSHLINPANYVADGVNEADTEVTLKDNQDHLSSTDLGNQADSCLTELTTKVPAAQLGIDDTYSLTNKNAPQATQNSSHGSYDGQPNRQLSVNDVKNGALAQYYMDGDSLIYDISSYNDNQSATVKFVDDDNTHNTSLPAVASTTGASGGKIIFDGLQEVVNNLLNQHYEINKVTGQYLTKAGGQLGSETTLANGSADWNTVFWTFDSIFDARTRNSQQFTIHLGHHKTTTTTTKTFTEVVHYRYNDGQTASPDQTATPLTFTRTVTHDDVTNTDSPATWDAERKTFAPVVSPTIANYKADQPRISGVSVKPTDQKTTIEKTVIYSPDIQTATVKYIDDTDNKTLTTKDLSGNSDADSGYSTTSTIDGYKNHGYVLVSDSSNG